MGRDLKKINILVIISCILIFSGLTIRFLNLPYVSGDFSYYFESWMNHIKDNGLLNSFAYNFANYTPLYLHILSLAILLKVNYLLYIKAVSFLFEIVCCLYVYRIMRIRFDTVYSFFSAAVIFLLPTIIMNGSQWGQCDIIYASLVIASFYYLMTEKFTASIIFLGLAFAFKQQSLFILPFYIALALKKVIPLKLFLFFPLPYLISILPSWYAGRSLNELLFLYINQDNPWARELVVNAPTVYNFFSVSEEAFRYFKAGGVAFTALAAFGLLYFFRKILEKENYLLLALLISVTVPFFLPRMHERYFIVAEILSVVYVLYFKREYWLPVLILIPSIVTYSNYLNGSYYLSHPVISILMFAAILMLVFNSLKELKKLQVN